MEERMLSVSHLPFLLLQECWLSLTCSFSKCEDKSQGHYFLTLITSVENHNLARISRRWAENDTHQAFSWRPDLRRG